MLIFSDWTMAAISSNKKGAGILVSIAETYLKFKKMRLRPYPLKNNPSLVKKGIHYLSSIFECCLPYIDKVIDYLGARELVTEGRYVSSHRLPRKLWKFISEELKRKSEDAEDTETTKRICSARESLLLWHVATALCKECAHESGDGRLGSSVSFKGIDYIHFSKLLSDYMIYLLVMRPTMMSAVAGIGQIRFRDTCAEAEKFFSRRALEQGQVKEACEKILDVDTKVKPVHVKGDRSKSILFDACMLAKELNKLDNNNNDNDDKWKIISKAWVEMLSYAATHCRPATHAQQVKVDNLFLLFGYSWLILA
uniref:Uncharacterized protein n=1 Tax=Quercus lobata TaxID=97700 RepID=A0A7N2REA9_QUELO